MDMYEPVIVDINYMKPDLKDESIRISCSGTVLDESEGLVLTTGLLFGPLFKLNSPQLHGEVCYQKLKDFFSCSRGQPILQRGKESDTFLKSDTKLLNYIEDLCQINVLTKVNAVNPSKNHFEKWGFSQADVDYYAKSLLAVPKAILNGGRREKTAKQFHNNNNNKDKSWFRSKATIVTIWRCSHLDKVLDSILNQSTGWSMTDKTDKKVHQDEEQIRTLLPFFAILKLNFSKVHSDAVFLKPAYPSRKLLHRFDKTLGPYLMDSITRPAISYGLDYVTKLLSNWSFKVMKERSDRYGNSYAESSNTQTEMWPEISRQDIALNSYLTQLHWLKNVLRDELEIGCKVQIVATPFGSLSPSVFINSVSKGVLSNLAGESGVLIMTDARCVPGCEGGTIFLDTNDPLKHFNKFGRLIGIVIAPFCWRQNEWVGLTFGCSLKPLLTSLFEAAKTHSDDNEMALGGDGHSIISNNSVSSVVNCVALINVGSRWGSAVLVRLASSEKQTFLVTCCHVVQQECGSTVRARFTSPNNNGSFYVDTKLIYITPVGQVYDIAILEVDPKFHHLLPTGIPLSTANPTEGNCVHAVGHGLFEERVSLSATVTSGNISKILYKKGKQVLVQSTCAVHPGTSGGALVCAKTMHLIGIIVLNARDAMCGASYPHINLSIPTAIFGPILNSYAINKDVSVLNNLHDPDPVLNNYWQLGDDTIEELQSKL